MTTTEYSTRPDEEEGSIPCLIVSDVDNDFPTSPSVPRHAPLIKLSEALEAKFYQGTYRISGGRLVVSGYARLHGTDSRPSDHPRGDLGQSRSIEL
jgi:hypothetical protein